MFKGIIDRNKTLVTVLLSVAVLTLCFCPSANAQISATAWAQVSDLQQKAYQAWQLEQNNPANTVYHRIRVARYALAWARLNASMEDTPSVDPLIELRLNYRRACFADYAEMYPQALASYMKCRNSPLLATALWEDRVAGKVLKPFVTDRLAQIKEDQQTSRSMHLTIVVHPKGDIQINQGDIRINPIEPPLLLTSDQQSAIAERLFLVGDENRTVTHARVLLSQLQGRKAEVVEPAHGLVVFGLSGNEEINQDDLEKLTAILSRRLVAFQQSVLSRYFRLNQPSPVVTVYANLMTYHDVRAQQSVVSQGPQLKDGNSAVPRSANVENFGATLSTCLHFDAMNESEGYYQPLDNSIVLRRGLRSDKGNWYFGTACHEIVHAMIHADAPQTPLWLDEGLASMHEALNDKGDPVDNFRLYYLKAALDTPKFPSIQEIIEAQEANQDPEQRFYAAASRYLCIFLYERNSKSNQLQAIYRKLREQSRIDPVSNSLSAILAVTGKVPMGDLNKEFQSFIKNRNTKQIDSTWGYLANPISDYVLNDNKLPWTRTNPSILIPIELDATTRQPPPTGSEF